MHRYAPPMPTEFSAVQVRAGLYFVVTRRWRGSSGVAPGAPRYTLPRPRGRYSAEYTMSIPSDCDVNPLTRLMNSMFDGHHGASSRTPDTYRAMASRHAGSSQLNGSRTELLGTPGVAEQAPS